MKLLHAPAFRFAWILLIALVGCAPDSRLTPTTVPVVSPTPAPSHIDVLDWNIRFSSSSQREILRCARFPENDVVQEIITPLDVTLRATLITPQILQQALITYESANPSLAQDVSAYLQQSERVFIVLSVVLSGQRDLYTPIELSPTLYPGRRDLLQNVQFLIDPETINLQLFDHFLESAPELDFLNMPITLGKMYMIPFMLGDLTLEEVNAAGGITLNLEAEIDSPIQNEICETGSELFSLNLSTAVGEGPVISEIYGDLRNDVSASVAADVRYELLTRLLPQTFGSVSPSGTADEVEAEATEEATQEVENE